MLQRIGDALTTRKWLTYVLFGALAIIFAAWGAYGIATLQFGGSTNAAKVNGETIPYDEVHQAWLQQQSDWQQRVGGEMPAQVKARLEDELLERFVRSTLMAQHTRELGYRVTDAQLGAAVRSEPAFQLEGRYSADVARMRLQQAGITEEAFEEDLRQALRAAELENGIRDSDFLTPAELQQIRALQSEQRKVQYAVLPAAKYASTAAPDDKSVQAYYDAHRADFMSPEFVHVRYAQLRLAQVASTVQLSDADLRDYYDKHKDRYVEPERRQARHILIAVNPGRNDAAALKRAQEVLAKAKAGANFASLAKQYSDDPGSAQQGGELGWSDRTSFVAPFADALFSMKPNEIAGPVKTQFGYHIIQLEGIQPGHSKAFDQARPEIEAQLRRDRAADRFGDIQEQIQQQLDQGTPTLEGLAKQFGMETGEVSQFVRGTGGGALGNSRELQDAVFSDPVLAEHHIGGPVLIGDDRLVLVRALDHHAASPKPLAEVRDRIVAALRTERANQAALAAAQAAAQRLDSGVPFDTVVHDLGVTAEPPHFVGRTDPSVPATLRDALFTLPRPAPGKGVFRAVALNGGGAALVAVTEVREDPTSDPAVLAQTRQQQSADYGTEAANNYVEQLRMTAKVQKNPQVFEQ
ncbi:MAG TPA: peptidyl-prolyl cis-trans isomerase [Steroidobacteraceae bacterium]|nr:peptidyl-prolyl cis-trans isomerase [Steroidobacteraceae bacterium]